MISGVNRIFEHEGRQYHIQGEDLGVDEACFEVRVYDGAAETLEFTSQMFFTDAMNAQVFSNAPYSAPSREHRETVRDVDSRQRGRDPGRDRATQLRRPLGAVRH